VGDIAAAARLTGWPTAVEAFADGFRLVALVAAALGVLAAVLTSVTLRREETAQALPRDVREGADAIPRPPSPA